MHYQVVALSTGASSAVAADRVIQRYGMENTILLFADTLFEDFWNYYFLVELEAYWGTRIVRLVDGRTPHSLADEQGIIPNQKIHPCTLVLKIKPQIAYVKGLLDNGHTVTMNIGMNVRDAKPKKNRPQGRLDAPRKNWGKFGVSVEYPILWETPIEDTEAYVTDVMKLKLPDMYRLGYPHANCGGECVAQGHRDWLRTLQYKPGRFHRSEEWENTAREDPKRAKYALLRDQSGGVVSPKTLQSLRLAYEKDRKAAALDADIDDPVCGVECGVGNEWEIGP